ncbi:MAG: R3H domain-containing nucleic acid-binding protein, partial [Acidobacteriota bacterium]|jgi:spoIIIJ-associated protein
VEEALEKAAAALGVAASELQHEVVEKKQDFWGLADDTVVIKAWKSAPEPAVEEPEEEAQETPEAAAEDEQQGEEQPEEAQETERAGDVEEAEKEEDERAAADQDKSEDTPAKEEESARSGPAEGETNVELGDISALLEQIFHDMEFECTVEVAAEEDGFLATVAGGDKEALLEGNGRCLSALELIANNAFRNRMARGTKIRVDAGDFRSRRDQELADVAYQVAHSAKQSGRTQETQPLNPYERRLVHLALAEDPAVTTRSRGSGFLKNVQVIPQSGGRGGRGNKGRRG